MTNADKPNKPLALSTSSMLEKGNAFRDRVAKVLAAAGFEISTEVRAGAKNADIEAVWIRDELEGPILPSKSFSDDYCEWTGS